MLIPQSSAFETLKRRLDPVTSINITKLIPLTKKELKEAELRNYKQLLIQFDEFQIQLNEYQRASM